MPSPTFQRPNLECDRKNKVIMHVARNKASVLTVLHEHFYPGVTFDACRKEVKLLCDEGYLTQFPLWGRKSYFRPGRKAISVWSLPRKSANRLGVIGLPYEIGCLAYTYMGSVVKRRLLPFELSKKVPAFPGSLVHCWAYVWHEESLSTIRVEPRCSQPRRLIEKFSRQLYRYRETERLEELYADDRLRFVVVVASEPQELALQQANEDLGQPLPLETAHYDELIRFV